MTPRAKMIVGFGTLRGSRFVLTRASTWHWGRSMDYRDRVREVVEREARLVGVPLEIVGRDVGSAREGAVLQTVVPE